MAEFDKQGRRLITVVRVLEYHGTDEWIQKVMEASRLPLQGEYRPDPKNGDVFIRSGLVTWNVIDEEGEQRPPVIPIPPGPTSVQ